MTHTDDMVPVLTASVLATYRAPSEPLTAHDRCDACGAAAQIRAHWPPTEQHPRRRGALQFCGHHYRKHEPKLVADGWAVAVKGDGWTN